MRIKRFPKFQTEFIYRESPDKKDRLRQLWDLLLALPEPENNKNNQINNKNNYENQKIKHANI